MEGARYTFKITFAVSVISDTHLCNTDREAFIYRGR